MIDYARYQRDYEKEQEEKGIWPYYSDLPLIKYCHAFGFPVHSHEYFRDVTKRWPYVLCEIPDVRLIAIPNVGIGFLSRGLEEHLLFDCISANGFKAEKRMKSNPPQESFRPYDGYAGDAALLIGSSPPFGDFLNCQFTRLMYRDLFPHLKDTPLITSAGMGASSYDLFNAIGIPTEQVIRLPDYHFIECERLFVPTILAGLSAELDNFFYPPEPAHWLRDRLTVACCEEDAENPPTPTRKVYISRKSAKQRVTGNEDEIIELVGSAGVAAGQYDQGLPRCLGGAACPRQTMAMQPGRRQPQVLRQKSGEGGRVRAEEPALGQ